MSRLLRNAKLATIRAVSALRLDRALLKSAWRRERLLILCYHGISLEDEHLWDSSLYMPRETLRRRFESLRHLGANVLPLAEALQRLSAGTLPPRSAVITFDDGNFDFYGVALPLLSEFSYPATLYLTTYYSDFNRPVFDVAASYLLWKSQKSALEWPDVLEKTFRLDARGRATILASIKDYAKSRKLSGIEKDELLSELAIKLGIDYEAFCRSRLFHLMTPEETRHVAAAGIDIQLHTHRHRTSSRRELFWREIDDNRECIARITPKPAEHFCYPGGFHLPQFPEWLREKNVASATTCAVGLATRKTDRLLLPRLVDHTELTQQEFESWISGLAVWLPGRSHVMASGQLLEN